MGRSLLGVLASGVLVACASATPAARTPGPAPGWNVQVATSGGFAGGGRGAVSVSADGRLVAQPARGRTRPAERPCEATLAEPELRRIAAAVAAAQTGGWASAKLERAAPDAFRYELTLTRDGAPSRVVWYDNTVNRLPADLAELYAGVQAAWDRVVEACAAS